MAAIAPVSPSPTRKPKKAGVTHDKIATQLFASGSGTSPGNSNATGSVANEAASACADAILMLSPARQKKATA